MVLNLNTLLLLTRFNQRHLASEGVAGQSLECSIANAFSELFQAHGVIITILQNIGAVISNDDKDYKLVLVHNQANPPAKL